MDFRGDRTVLVVNDDEEMRHTLQVLFKEAHFDVVGEAGNAHEAMSIATRLQPAFVILDHYIPMVGGPSVANALRLLAPRSRIVAFSALLKEFPDWADAWLPKSRIGELADLLEGLASN